MSDLQVGDTVRIVTEKWDGSTHWSTGAIGTLEKGKSLAYPFELRVEGGPYTMPVVPDEVEKFEEEESVGSLLDQFEDETVDDNVTLAILQAMGVNITEEEYATALEVSVLLYNARMAKENASA